MSAIHGQPPSPEDLKWLELMDAARKDSLRSIEEAAKQLIGLDGLISGIYFGAFAFTDLSGLRDDTRLLFIAPVVLWLASLVMSVRALMPRAYAYNPHSPDEAREVYMRLVAVKDRRLKIALWIFVASIVALVIALWAYLGTK